MGDVTLSVIPPEHVQQFATIMAKVKTGKENHDEVLEKMSAEFYNSNLYTRILTNEVLKDLVKTTPTVGKPVVVNIPRKFVALSWIEYSIEKFSFLTNKCFIFDIFVIEETTTVAPTTTPTTGIYRHSLCKNSESFYNWLIVLIGL